MPSREEEQQRESFAFEAEWNWESLIGSLKVPCHNVGGKLLWVAVE